MEKLIDPEPEKYERRPLLRKRVLLTGLIVYGQDAFTCDCKFRDVSGGGARIALAYPAALPSRFHLINVREGTAHESRVIWKRSLEIGVKFESTLSLSTKPDIFLERLKKLWRAKIGG